MDAHARRVITSEVVKFPKQKVRQRRRGRDGDLQQVLQDAEEGRGREEGEEECYNPVHCAGCETEVGLREVGEGGVYHFFQVVASNS